MLLAIDVGNTNTNLAVFKGDTIVSDMAITTKTPRTADEYAATFRELMRVNGISHEDINACIISSVVPGIMYYLKGGIVKLFGIQPLEVGAGVKTGVKIKLANPKEVGADRIVDLAAGFNLYGGPVMVIDYGTATTYDLIDETGTFMYGLTCPGIRISANALWHDTAKLPEIELALPPTILANDTISSMQAGLLYGTIGQTEYIIERVKKESGISEMKVVATGGLGELIAGATDKIDVYDRSLTMKGLHIIYEKNR
ncbi:MAG: type III pantothenate kinase [Lachnospiraceae bacterium]|nr:type III pantothenate kinase [Lachnospiraceae bacterium]